MLKSPPVLSGLKEVKSTACKVNYQTRHEISLNVMWLLHDLLQWCQRVHRWKQGRLRLICNAPLVPTLWWDLNPKVFCSAARRPLYLLTNGFRAEEAEWMTNCGSAWPLEVILTVLIRIVKTVGGLQTLVLSEWEFILVLFMFLCIRLVKWCLVKIRNLVIVQ